MFVTSPADSGLCIQLTVSPTTGAGINAPCTDPEVGNPHAFLFAIHECTHGNCVTPEHDIRIGSNSAFCWTVLAALWNLVVTSMNPVPSETSCKISWMKFKSETLHLP
jgi:hypothetical protein